jgi:hypothetical protein
MPALRPYASFRGSKDAPESRHSSIRSLTRRSAVGSIWAALLTAELQGPKGGQTAAGETRSTSLSAARRCAQISARQIKCR